MVRRAVKNNGPTAQERIALAERLSMLTEQLQGASAQLSNMVSELREQAKEDSENLERRLNDGSE